MPISEAERSDLYTGLAEVLGPTRAEIMMTVYRLHESDEFATKGDMSDLRGDFADLRGEFADLRAEFADLRADFADLRAEFKVMSGQVTTLAASVARIDAKMDRFIFILLASLLALVGVAFFR